jgi:hypothetical protein
MSAVTGQQGVGTTVSEFNTLTFVVQMMLQKVQTVTLVKVISCSNSGGLSPVGTVTVQPLVNQMTGNRQAVAHGQIFNIPYLRIQGGANAVIIDPEPGDLGMAAFCSRDISAVKSAKGSANPGSFRMFDWADGLYLGGFLNGTPQQYIQFSAGGITVVSPTKITLQAPTVEVDASALFKVSTADAEIDSTGPVGIQGTTVAATGSASVTLTAPAIGLAGPVSQTGGVASSFSGDLTGSGLVQGATVRTAGGVDLGTHEHHAGTYNIGGTPVTGDSGAPI